MPTTPLDIIGGYNKQRFSQFNGEDTANWYIVQDKKGKNPAAMYPAMGRKHVTFLNQNKLQFGEEPRAVFSSIDYMYFVVGNQITQVDKFYNEVIITLDNSDFVTNSGNIFFDYLVRPDFTLCMFCDGAHAYVFNETTLSFLTVTDANTPSSPTYVAAFGDRFVVAGKNTSEFRLTQINGGSVSGSNVDPALVFTVSGSAVFAQEAGIIKNFAVLHNQLYIFTDFTTGVWSNNPSVFNNASFPWRKNTSYNWDYGLQDSLSLSTDFGMIVFLGKNKSGLVQVMASTGGQPQDISNNAIDVLFENQTGSDDLSPFISLNANGFLYQYENTIFYRLSAGKFNDFGVLDLENSANSIEYNFRTQSWHRVIEKNGERNKIQKHVFFNNKHFVTVADEGTVYEMSGKFYVNEVRNTAQPDEQKSDTYIAEPMRYERRTPIISMPDYSEFITKYVEIDFIYGESDQYRVSSEEANVITQTGDFIVTETDDMIITETFAVSASSNAYYSIFRPYIELFFSDDGGISFYPADLREFAVKGEYRWRMRWYQLGPSRNRVYKLVCVSTSPIVVLGAVTLIERASGGAN